MKKLILLGLFASLFLITSCKVSEDEPTTSPDAKTISITGTVIDSTTSSPVEFALIRILDGTTELSAATTNNTGKFSTSVSISEEKTLFLSVIKDGYSAFTGVFTLKTDSETQNFSIKIKPLTTSVDSVIVLGKVIDSKTGEVLDDAEIRFYDTSIAVATTKSDATGNFSATFPQIGTKELRVVTVKASYLADTTSVIAVAGEVSNLPTIKLFPLQEAIAGEPASVFLVSQTLDAIGVTQSGSPETAKIVFEVQDSSGIPIDLDHAVYVNFRFGATPGGGEILAPGTAKTNDVGQVTVNLTSGTIAGPVQIIAEIDFKGMKITSKPVNIAIHGGLPDLTHFSIGTNQLNYAYYDILAGVSKVTALVGDKYTNPVKPNTVVYFSSDAGVIQGSGLTNELGTTTVTLLSGAPLPNDPVDGPGFFWVHARTINEKEESISTKTKVLFSGYPHITISPTTFTLPNGGKVSFHYTVTDQFGNPLAPGNNYSVSIATGGDAGVAGDIAIIMPDMQIGNTSFDFALSDTKPEEVKLKEATIFINVSGPNGRVTGFIEGTVE